MARWVRRRDRAGRVLVIANQMPGVLERYGLTRTDVERAAWTVEPDGRRQEGAAAINRTLGELGGGWALLSAPYRVAPLAAAEEAFYRWFAHNRPRFHRFGVRPECDEPDAGCQ